MIFLLGISRNFQVYASKPVSEGGLHFYNYRHLAMEYEKYLREVIGLYRLQAVAEEFSWNKLSRINQIDNEAFLVAKMVCLEMGLVRHEMLDAACNDECIEPNSTADTHRKIKLCSTPATWRDKWHGQIRTLAHGNTLLICCANHIASLRRELDTLCEHSVICENFSSKLGLVH